MLLSVQERRRSVSQPDPSGAEDPSAKEAGGNAPSGAVRACQDQTVGEKEGKEEKGEGGGKKKRGKFKWIWILLAVGMIVVLFVMCSLSGGPSTGDKDVRDRTSEEDTTEKGPKETETVTEETVNERQNDVLELYTEFQDNDTISYELNEKAKAFLTERYDYFPLDAEGGAAYAEGVVDRSIETKMINKNPDKFGDKLIVLSQVEVVQIQELSYDGRMLSFLNLADGAGDQYSVIYPGELPDIYEDDTLSVVVGLPLGNGTFENTSGGSTWAVVLAGSYIAEDASAVPEDIGTDLAAVSAAVPEDDGTNAAEIEDHSSEFCGEWFDSFSQRCDMVISSEDGTSYTIKIDWSSSAWENTEWVLTAVYDEQDNGLRYHGSKCNYTYPENGAALEEYDYHDGECFLYIDSSGLLHWDDYVENAGENCLFEKDVTTRMYVVNCSESITLRNAPSTAAEEITHIPLYGAVDFLSVADNGFYQVSYNGQVGYALAPYLDIYEPEVYTGATCIVVNCNESITLRTSPSTGAGEICQIPLGSVVDYIEAAANGFYLVNYDSMVMRWLRTCGYNKIKSAVFLSLAVCLPLAAAGTGYADDGWLADTSPLYTYEEMEKDIRQLEERTGSDMLSVESIGTTFDGRELYHVCVGRPDASRHVLITGAIHAREYMTAQLVMKQLIALCEHFQNNDLYGEVPYAELLDDVMVHFLPMVNSDGVSISQSGLCGARHRATCQMIYRIYENDNAVELDSYLRQWKANARGVDLNRNFDTFWEEYQSGPSCPSSGGYKGETFHCETESMALVGLTEKYRFERTISYHTQGQVIYWYFGQEGSCLSDSEELAELVSGLTGYSIFDDFHALDPAGYKDWAIAKMGIPSLTIEVGHGSDPVDPAQFGDIWEQNRDVVPAVLLDLKGRAGAAAQ